MEGKAEGFAGLLEGRLDGIALFPEELVDGGLARVVKSTDGEEVALALGALHEPVGHVSHPDVAVVKDG